jgi:cellulose synthase/poly-beta-1,6-N-acetylglucosamine synthase-like glycosyltransferase
VTAAVFTAVSLSSLWHLRWVRRLPAGLDAGDLAKKVGCSIVIAARDEEARIENTVRHLLAQEGVDLEVIVVDDRSRDRTAEILRRMGSEDSRVQVKRIEALPEGWLGKCHACHVGASAASREWILFTDADCWLKPDLIERAIAMAAKESGDHVTLTPGLAAESVWTKSWHLMFMISMLGWIARTNRDRPGAHLGIGAFNLVRGSVYREMGGYEKLRLTVLDDVRFGLLVRRAGKRTRAFLGVDDVECHWGSTVRNMIKLMEKNYFAALDFRLEVVIGAVATVLVAAVIAVMGLASGTLPGVMAGLSPLLGVVPAAMLARRLGWSITAALGMPFMFPVFIYAMLNSTFVTLRQGGVRWRDTFYPLKTLREGMVRGLFKN